MSFPKIELSLNPAGVGAVKLDGVDISKGIAEFEYRAAPDQLSTIKITLVADVEAVFSFEPECLKVLESIMPEDGIIKSMQGRIRHYKTSNGRL